MKRYILTATSRLWAWACAWVATPAGRRAVAAFVLALATEIAARPDVKPALHILAAAILSSGVLHASRQGPGTPEA